MKHFVKGSKEAKEYMARLRKMRGKGGGKNRKNRGGNPPMLVIGNPGPKMPSRKKLEDHYWKSIHPDYKNVGAKGKARKVLTLNERTQATTITPLNQVSIYKLMDAWNNSHPSARIPNPARGPADPHAATELRLFIDNDADLYRQQTEPIIKNLMRKRAAGKYDREKAVKLWMYLVENGAKKYCRQFCASEADWKNVFNKNTRLVVARALRDYFEAEAELGNYDHYIPKKYRKNPSIMADVVSGAAFGAGGLMAERALSNPVSKKAQGFISKKIGKLVREGYPQDQAIAIAYSMARRKGYKVPPAPNAGALPTIRRKKGKRRGNPKELPAHIANDPKFKKALKEFRKRHGADPVEIREVEVPKGFPKFLVPYGQAPHAVYDAASHSNKGKRIHHFGKGKRGKKTMPWLVTSPERGAKFLAYVGGTFKAKPDWLYD